MHQFYQWKRPDSIFRQGRRALVKNLVSGDETTAEGGAHMHFMDTSDIHVLFSTYEPCP